MGNQILNSSEVERQFRKNEAECTWKVAFRKEETPGSVLLHSDLLQDLILKGEI